MLPHGDPVSERARRFYDAHPFPGYGRDRYNSALDLFGFADGFARALDYQIPYGARIVDMGCGTGQLACFLSLKERPTLGLDISATSLDFAWALARRLHLPHVRFEQADILGLPPPAAAHDYILCLGVLHHTADPRRGFANVVSYGRAGSFVIIGLYNPCGRLWYRARRRLRVPFNRRGASSAPQAGSGTGGEKDHWWFVTQDEQPPESSHTVGEVLGWFEEQRVDFVNASPGFAWRDRRLTGLFVPHARPRPAARWWAQMRWLWSLRGTGGYFVMIGRIR